MARLAFATLVSITLLMRSGAALAGDAEDCRNRYLPLPEDTAAACFRLAEQGDSQAQLALGYYYLSGFGVEKDLERSVSWYRRAAEQGLEPAQTSLAGMYMSGQGVTHDKVQALKWLTIAVASVSRERQEQVVKLRDMAAKRMTAPEIAEAETLAREWKPKIEAP